MASLPLDAADESAAPIKREVVSIAPPPAPFLRAGNAPDLPFPVREGCRVTPLPLASHMYPALERLAIEAEKSIWLAFRIFDPDTTAKSELARSLGLKDWTAILEHAVRRGVHVRVLLTDFEPTFAHGLHSLSWGSFTTLRRMADALPKDVPGSFEMIVAPHQGEVGWATRKLLALPMGRVIRRVLAELAKQSDTVEQALNVRPGLWRYFEMANGAPRFRRGPAPRLWPAIYHHKFAVIDGVSAIVGGIDVNERRWDTAFHEEAADQTWHDVSVRLDGPVVGDVATHFARLWNRELTRVPPITQEWVQGTGRTLSLDPLNRLELAPEPMPTPSPAGGARVQLLRTQSARATHPFAVGPRPHIQELMHVHRKLILEAKELLYIEAQFFRVKAVARWIAEAARRSPKLNVIVVLPQAPEEVAFKGERTHPAHIHGEWQQSRALGHLKRWLGDRVAIVSLARKQRLTPEEEQFRQDRGAAFGSGMIYVHSKLLIVDDHYALVSSANINGRSFAWDDELGVLVEDRESVGLLRKQLWCELTQLAPDRLPGFADAAAFWADLANSNVMLAPEERQGFVVRYLWRKARRFGRPRWFVPDDLV